jgi:hypothetical protein
MANAAYLVLDGTPKVSRRVRFYNFNQQNGRLILISQYHLLLDELIFWIWISGK